MPQHKLLAEADLHENKGASTAAVDTVATSDGLGGTTWVKVSNTSLEGISADGASGYFLLADGTGGFSFAPAAHASIYFSDFTTPYALAATTSYAKVAATTTVGGSPIAFTESTTSRLTYTGSSTLHMDCVFSASFDQTTGADKDIYVALYKNGALVAGTEIAVTTVSAKKAMASIHSDIQISTNDYLEVYCKVSAATTVNFYTITLQTSIAGV